MALVKFNFESQYLGNNHTVGIILPDKPRDVEPKDFYDRNKKYKVLWLLHGTFGDYSDWIRKSMIELYACENDLIVVMPSAMNSIYENWPDFGLGFNMWDYFFEELMPVVYNWFPASDKREDNFIAGLSMGGRGTAKFVCGHPEKFAAAAVLSSSPRDLRAAVESGPDRRMMNDIKRAGSVESYLESPENTWDHFTELAGTGKLPRLYFCCGEDDGALENFRKFEAYAKEIGLDATFETEPGYRHEWRFWDLYIQKALLFFGLDKNAAGNPF